MSERAPGGNAPYVEPLSEFRVARPGTRCRHPRCGKAAVLEMNRRQTRWNAAVGAASRYDAWWSYCEEHTYGRIVRDGQVWYDPNAARRLVEGVPWAMTPAGARFLLDCLATRADEGGHTPTGFGEACPLSVIDRAALARELEDVAELAEDERRLLATVIAGWPT